MKLTEINNIVPFPSKHNTLINSEYQSAYEQAINTDNFPMYSISKAIKKFKIVTKQQADANFHTSDHNTMEWIIFRNIQQQVLIKKLRSYIGPGSTNANDYHTNTIRMETSKDNLDGSKLGSFYVNTVLGNWYSITIEGEMFLVRFPTGTLIKTVDIAPTNDATPSQLKEMDHNISQQIKAASNFLAHTNRSKLIDVNNPTQSILNKPKTDIDWVS